MYQTPGLKESLHESIYLSSQLGACPLSNPLTALHKTCHFDVRLVCTRQISMQFLISATSAGVTSACGTTVCLNDTSDGPHTENPPHTCMFTCNYRYVRSCKNLQSFFFSSRTGRMYINMTGFSSPRCQIQGKKGIIHSCTTTVHPPRLHNIFKNRAGAIKLHSQALDHRAHIYGFLS